MRAGPRLHLYFEPSEVKALILSVGSIVSGINTVVKEIANSLRNLYGVSKIYGAKYGYKGIIEELFVEITDEIIESTHT